MSSNTNARLLHWDLIYRLIEKDIKKKEDVLVAVIHLVLINDGYSCIGTGSSGVLTGEEKKSEHLPDKWNENQDFALRYIKDGKLNVLRTTHMDDDMVINFLNVSESKVNSAVFNVPATVSEVKGDLNELVPTCNEVVKKIKAQLLLSDKETGTQTQACQQELRASRSTPTEPTTRRPSVGIIPGPLGPLGPDRSRMSSRKRENVNTLARSWSRLVERNLKAMLELRDFSIPPFQECLVEPTNVFSDRLNRLIDPLPFGYGRSDLDPFSQGGGMIFNPNSPQGIGRPALGIPGSLPRGAIPPGARFDPMGPPDRDRRRGPNFPGPDPDHMPPPGYDSMFM